MTLGQSMRPRHQVLVLKCYPRFQKTAVEVKPNGSELSYLLYYASTRRSKLRKVGAFLEKKTDSDIWRLRSGNVLVTLQILQALIEKCPRDLPLFSAHVLRILQLVLHGQDITLMEESVPTFQAFCEHYDSTQMSADQDHRAQYEEIINLYASHASKSRPAKFKTPPSIPLAVRYRTVGLRAISALVSSPPFAQDDGRLSRSLVPIVLDNLISPRSDYLILLQKKDSDKQTKTGTLPRTRRQSVSISRAATAAADDEDSSAAAAGTTADVDQRAEEGVGLLALDCLKHLFSGETRSHLRPATSAALAYAKDYDLKRISNDAPVPPNGTWACQLFELMCRYSAVQDRFIILITTMEALIRSPIVEDDLGNQLVLTRLVSWLLKSSVNFIGLSIIDILVGMIQHILLLLQLGGEGSAIRPHSLKQDALASHPVAGAAETTPATASSNGTEKDAVPVIMEVVNTPSPLRKQLLAELQQCTADLATHVYYSDQIGDMVSALLLRLKPTPAPGMENSVTAIENPVQAAENIADSVALNSRPQADGFFSFDTARILALAAVRDIIVVANTPREDGVDAAARNRVSLSVWEGTQWLLRDPDTRVRAAYVESLLTWLKFETTKIDLRATSFPVQKNRSNTLDSTPSKFGRATSNASRRSPGRSLARSSFLQLLNLAIYDSALEFAESEPDVLILHLLNHALMTKLGVNGVRYSLPMIYALQDELATLQSTQSKIAIGSLVHGYFWSLSDFFGFDTSVVGRAIFDEITRRSQNETWLPEIYVPPMPFEKIAWPAEGAGEKMKLLTLAVDLRALGFRREIVVNIEDNYGGTILSPPNSPPASPGRPSVLPSLNAASFTGASPLERLLPEEFKEQMLAEWSREDCIAVAENEAVARSNSLTRSKPGSASGRQRASLFLTHSGMTSRSDIGSVNRADSLAAPTARERKLASPGASSRAALSSSSGRSVVRVSHLKSVLAGNEQRSSLHRSYNPADDDDDNDSESLISTDFANDSFIEDTSRLSIRDSQSFVSRPSGDASGARIPDGDIPPVPLLPTATSLPQLQAPFAEKPLRGSLVLSSSGASDAGPPKVNLDRLLDGLTSYGAQTPSSMAQPPY